MEPFIVGALLFCNPTQPGPYPAASVVVDAYGEAYNRGAPEGIAALVSRDATIVRGDQTLNGEELANNFRRPEFDESPDFTMTVRDRQARDNLVTQTESYTIAGRAPELVLTVYEVKGGCIVRILASSAERSAD
jgi:hypothetical protein